MQSSLPGRHEAEIQCEGHTGPNSDSEFLSKCGSCQPATCFWRKDAMGCLPHAVSDVGANQRLDGCTEGHLSHCEPEGTCSNSSEQLASWAWHTLWLEPGDICPRRRIVCWEWFVGNVVSQDICSGIVQAGPRMQRCKGTKASRVL